MGRTPEVMGQGRGLEPESSPLRAVVSVEPALPAILAEAGPAARFGFEEFLYARISNPHTKKAYARAIRDFFRWCDAQSRFTTDGRARPMQLADITPMDVGRYRDRLNQQLKPASVKLQLSGIRHLFDVLVERHALLLNPAASVRGPKLDSGEGVTPQIGAKYIRALLDTMTQHSAHNPVRLRDRAIIGVLTYTAAREGAIAHLTCGDYLERDVGLVLNFREKGGKFRPIPVRHDLMHWLDAYLAVLPDGGKVKGTPLFRTVRGKTRRFTARPMRGTDIWALIKRRLREIGAPEHFSPHSFRGATATNLLEQDVPLADVQYLLGHADPRTTRIYDHRQKQVTRHLVERISI